MPFFEANGFRMHYEIIENALPHDTLFIHGNLSSNAWWKPCVEVWKNRGKQNGRAILAEWRGCGKSTGPEFIKELNIPTLANDYIELVKSLDLSSLNLVAHSTGGPIAVQAMYEAPELFQRAALLNPVGAKGLPFTADSMMAIKLMSENREVCANLILKTIQCDSLDSDIRETIVSDAFHVHPLIWQGVPLMLQALDYASILENIKQPVLVLHGENDSIVPIKDSLELAKGFLRGSFYCIPGRGHSANVEDPQLFAILLDPFLFG